MPKIIWNGPGMKPPLLGPVGLIKDMRQKRYKVLRRGQKWMVRHRLPAFGQNCIWELSLDPSVLKYKTIWRYEDGYDHDFWFNTKQEALMFLLKCKA